MGHSATPSAQLSQATVAIHGDEAFDLLQDGAPALHFATTFRYCDDPNDLVPVPHRKYDSEGPPEYYYSRIAAPTNDRFEAALSKVLEADAFTFPSGLSAFHPALLLLNPKRIAIRDDFYFGCQAVIDIVARLSGIQKIPLDSSSEELEAGDLVFLETPLSPSGHALDIARYAEKAHARGAYLFVSSTLAPPGLQNPFAQGADLVMHAGSKYFGGHADMLCGILAVRNADWSKQIRKDRSILGNVLSSFDSWLGLRSLRTLPLRVQRQSQSTADLVSWLVSRLEGDSEDSSLLKSAIESVGHTSLQQSDFPWLLLQMPNGFGSVFSVTMKSDVMARILPAKLKLFRHQTSFGGVESSVEWRKMSDVGCDSRLLRFSVGLEAREDLRDDILSAVRGIVV